MKEINSSFAPDAVGPYSQAISTKNTLYLSGQLGIDKETGKMHGQLEDQVHQIFKNIQFVLDEENLQLSDIIKTTVLMTDIDSFSTINTIYEQYVSKPYPARTAYAVSTLPLNGLVEIEVIADKSS